MNGLLERFSKKVDFSGDCWLWTASKSAYGYGMFGFKKKVVQAHRFSWEHHFGEIPSGLLVCHKCDIRNCINPNHLFLGTHKDNAADCLAKGRTARGESSGQSKLKLSQVIEIRKTCKNYSRGEFSQRKLAIKYGVKPSIIGFIVNNRCWKTEETNALSS